LHLFSGLVLFAYVGLHLLNHALGIFSLSLAEIGLRIARAFWRFSLMTVLCHSAKFNPNFLIQKARGDRF
jgi:adenylate cyclase